MVDRFPVEAGHIMLFARAVGDTNPIYYSEEAAKQTEPGGIIAPPTFVQASAQFDPEYGLRPKIGQRWFGSGKSPSGSNAEPPAETAPRAGGGGGSGLHAEQHYEYHRHLRPGDVLHAVTKPGKTWEAEGRRAGKLKFSESITEYYDQNNNLVITARSVGVQTERPVSQG
ncbi:MAG: MaoC family dehydratase [Chloroflexi bacterium]|nr:MaoC family dehydratase [Chloroflexota bacterium]